MAGVLERIRWSPKRASENSLPAPRVDRRILELQAAKEILAEIFDVGVSDVEEMILNRYEEVCHVNDKREEWPQEFWVGQ
jgi:hypothetical protein